MFGLHKQGYIFPMYLNVRPVDKTFGGVMQPVDSPDNFMIVMNGSLRVRACCAETMTMMGVDKADLEEQSVVLSDYMEEEEFEAAHTIVRVQGAGVWGVECVRIREHDRLRARVCMCYHLGRRRRRCGRTVLTRTRFR